jgi:lysophospholipid acyltransferase (LPLAT)-like uncharacterized protein
MADNPSQQAVNEAIVAKARKNRLGRSMTFWRMQGYRVAVVLGWLVMEVLWRTGRVRIIGEQHLQSLIDEYGAVLPVCWHQHLLLCARYLVARRVRGLRIGFLISPSLDGEAPSMLAQLYGAQVIRGSGTHTGPQAVRALYRQVKDAKLSPLITPDGPRGPRFEFKGGAITVGQLCGVPIVPLAYAASRVKLFSTWDKFVLPWPFSRIVIAIGESYLPPRKSSAEQLDSTSQQMAQRLRETYALAAAELEKSLSAS